ncbi:hypothetical protein GOP47_0018434 [Adiantum capillus-veneris]|uniref:Uncharacterized protein n=1 Tax=Adiantum capillus-veneris TaxID=13818 RepID=A0A9D4UDE1_ADICA|nr:hypothetical protein GOP47_0018434 [Adiantum capillus-veneris]
MKNKGRRSYIVAQLKGEEDTSRRRAHGARSGRGVAQLKGALALHSAGKIQGKVIPRPRSRRKGAAQELGRNSESEVHEGQAKAKEERVGMLRLWGKSKGSTLWGRSSSAKCAPLGQWP